jgi:hypothetical protein
MSFLFVLTLMLSATSGASGADAATTENAQPSAKANASKKTKPKKICRTDTQDTGSRIMKRVCKTEEEWQNEASSQEIQAKSKGY